jgi:hypothetical protein
MWRHVPVYQLLSAIDKKALWFSAISRLEDKFEGKYTLQDARRLEQLASLSRRSRGVPEDIERDYLAKRLKTTRERAYVSCWYAGDDESAGLWQRTSRPGDFVAIQTTFSDLEAAFRQMLYVAEVRYIDYEDRRIPVGSILNPFFCKRSIFAYENEVRLLLYRPREETPASGHYVRAAIRRVVKRVMLAPHTEAWVKGVLQEVLAKYGLRVPIVPSAVDAEPAW